MPPLGVLVLLGVVQGVSEFLPVSSSGHLVLLRAWFGLAPPGASLEVALHAGTLAAVVWFYRRDLGRAWAGWRGGGPARGKVLARLALLAWASLPAGALALGGRTFLELQFGRPLTAAWGLVATTLLLASVRWAPRGRKAWPGPGAALAVGAAQALALMPGVSRSGATLVTGRWLGLTPEGATRFSFLLSIPAVAGAMLVEGRHWAHMGMNQLALLAAAAAVAATTGWVSLGLLVRLARQEELPRFAAYTAAVAAMAFAWLLRP
jgi:undecaprenyl-diphosphatase